MKPLRIIAKILLLPFTIAYLFTFSLWVMPLIYGKRKWGLPLYVICWVTYWCLSPITLIPFFGKHMGKLNNCANWAMGYSIDETVSHRTGCRVNLGIASWVEVFHLRLFATYDKSGWHGSKLCKGII